MNSPDYAKEANEIAKSAKNWAIAAFFISTIIAFIPFVYTVFIEPSPLLSLNPAKGDDGVYLQYTNVEAKGNRAIAFAT